MHQYKELKVWKLSRVFCSDIYLTTDTFPKNELYSLISQLRRASVSVPSNIAEGASRSSNKNFARFLEIAMGSAYEIETQLLISKDLNFINDEKKNPLIERLTSIIKMISKLKTTLKY